MMRCDGDDRPEEPMTVGTGSVSPADSGRPVCVLWVPDPEQRRGWREFYVYRDKPPGRPLGFRPGSAKP